MESLRSYLKDNYAQRKGRNSSYSIRAFARDLSLDHATLSQIMTGKRRITAKNFTKIAQALNLTDEQVKSMRHEIDLGLESYTTDSDHLIAQKNQWYMNVICELTRLSHFEPSIAWVSQTIGVPESEIEKAVNLLVELGELRVSEDKWEVAEYCTSTLKGTQMSNLAIAAAVKDSQRGFMHKQIEAFEELPFEEMSNYGLTLAFDPEKLPHIREKLLKALREVSREAERGRLDRRKVYRLNLSFFPVSK